jgi:hypothetical protein
MPPSPHKTVTPEYLLQDSKKVIEKKRFHHSQVLDTQNSAELGATTS